MEEHIIRIRNGCTLAEMTHMNLPANRHDPIIKQMMPNFYYFSNKNLETHKSQGKNIKENIKTSESKAIPPMHYIEDQFYPYMKAKIANKPLFSKISTPNTEQISSSRSVSASKFRTSKYPNVPLTKELIEKVENLNSFRELTKRSSKRITPSKPPSQITTSRKSFRSGNKISGFKYWEQFKKEKYSQQTNMTDDDGLTSKMMETCENSSARMQTRPKSENTFRKNRKIKQNEFVNTIESGSSVISPLAPVYSNYHMIPQSPNVMPEQYTNYGNCFSKYL
ncbi:hypothetical protein SteCoe_5037 [Stentor coeruleus]|uniref:Uncharacterized protein n=1 Tax=Stentor coeruleus TaxID=5963 RepID=A0A1R2CTB5_9CILI|nr:hypothetical protein SteCoe_5037 [Stentor coeruleus]